MKILKKILVALAVILVIAAIGIYFLPNHFSVTNSIVINKPVDVVYAQLQDFSKWDSWSPWKEKEPEAKGSVEGTPGTPGHKMNWEGKKLGEGSMTLTWAVPNQSISSNLVFVKPFNGTMKDIWKLEANGDKTTVTWTNAGGSKYPLGRLMGLSVDKMIGGEQKHGLDNLKKFCESLPDSAPVASADTAAVKSM